MNKTKTLLFAGIVAVAMIAGQAYATSVIEPGEPPPPGWILNLDGQPIPNDPPRYTLKTAYFTATRAATNITFALRDDTFDTFFLDNIAVASLTSPSFNLIRNGDFENGTAPSGGNASAPVEWQYLNPYGALYGSTVACGGYGQESSCAWSGGPDKAYDLLTQPIATAIGDTYQISFWALGPDEGNHWQELNTNCCVDRNEGTAFNVAVYAGDIPIRAVPEPKALGMFGFGVLLIGGLFMLRRRELDIPPMGSHRSGAWEASDGGWLSVGVAV